MLVRILCLQHERRADVRDGSFATEPSSPDADRCPLCTQKRPEYCSAAIGRYVPCAVIRGVSID